MRSPRKLCFYLLRHAPSLSVPLLRHEKERPPVAFHFPEFSDGPLLFAVVIGDIRGARRASFWKLRIRIFLKAVACYF